MPPDREAQERRTLWIIWGAMAWAVVIYGVVGAFVRRSSQVPESPPHFMGQLLMVAALVVGGASFALRGWLARQGDYQKYSMVRWGLAEAIGVFGLVYSFNGGSARTFFAFLGASVILLLIHRPSEADRNAFDERCREAAHG